MYRQSINITFVTCVKQCHIETCNAGSNVGQWLCSRVHSPVFCTARSLCTIWREDALERWQRKVTAVCHFHGMNFLLGLARWVGGRVDASPDHYTTKVNMQKKIYCISSYLRNKSRYLETITRTTLGTFIIWLICERINWQIRRCRETVLESS